MILVVQVESFADLKFAGVIYIVYEIIFKHYNIFLRIFETPIQTK